MLRHLYNSWLFAIPRESWDHMTRKELLWWIALDAFLIYQTYVILFENK